MLSDNDYPSAHEVEADEAGPRTLADGAREVLQSVSPDHLSPTDEDRLEAIEAAERDGADLSELEDLIAHGDARGVRDLADELGYDHDGACGSRSFT